MHLASYGNFQGTVYRADGTTPVAGARVTWLNIVTTTTDEAGHYTLSFLPLGSHLLSASDPDTRGIGSVTATLSVHGQTTTADIMNIVTGR